MVSDTVEILLSTYNGEKYLAEQLDSIIGQDYPHWRLLARDDGSTDSTASILNEYIQKYPDKMMFLKDNDGNLGYSASFSKLLRQSSADYVMYCDQDDYWEPYKISTMLSVIIEEETKLRGKAHVVFSDLQVADSTMNIVSKSFLKMMRYSSKRSVRIFYLKNYVPGCNMLFNRTLISNALKTDNIVNLHDHWLLMVCSAVGKITFINKSLMKYRVHDNNAIGHRNSHEYRLSSFFKDCLKFGFSNKKYRSLLYLKHIQQMQNICKILPTIVSKDATEFSEINTSPYFSRKIKNVTVPYILEKSPLKQLTYIICF